MTPEQGLWKCGKPQCGFRTFPQHYCDACGAFSGLREKIARALILDPCLILADEPTGNLDRKNRQLIFNLLRQEHRKGRGIILITHDMETAIQAYTIFQLEDGRLAPTKADSPTIGSI